MCGNPDAAEGCRQILKVIAGAVDYELKWKAMIKEFNFDDPDEPISGGDLIIWISNAMENEPVLSGLENVEWVQLKESARDREMRETIEKFQEEVLTNMVGCPPEFLGAMNDGVEDILA
jgi:hypothetical protein